ncbi:hypothetical protein GJ496_010315 [Pomphorhynchus laevis]|nr:hypothetical protein GJ496_010315 [Pomphorhynchus laevis]
MNDERKPGFIASLISSQKNTSKATSNDDYFSSSQLSSLSPYMNFDPNLIASTNASQFIIPEGQAEHRGRLELMFFTIGTAILTGGAIGATTGFVNGFKASSQLPYALRRTMILNYITRQSTVGSSTFGSIGLLYSLTGVFVSKLRSDVDDELNTVFAQQEKLD